MKPLGERVFIKPTILTKSEGGLHLPQCRVDMPNTGTIVAVGAETSEKFGIKTGDRVLFDRHYQTLAEDQETTIVKAEHVMAVLL